MTTIKTAKEAYTDTMASVSELQKAEVAKAIDNACAANKFSCFVKISADLAKYLRDLGYSVDEQTSFGKIQGYQVSWDKLPPEFVEVTTKEALDEALAGDEAQVYVTLAEDIVLDAASPICIPAGKKATIKVDSNITVAQTGFAVEDGGELILKGEGTIKSTNKSTSGAIVEASGKNAKVVIDGVTLDCITEKGKAGNYAFACYLLNDASLDMKSGVIKTAYGSCISTNNTTGGNTTINITGGELYSDGSYAIYLAAQGTVNIKGGKIQGINARMGHFNISGDAEIIPTTIDINGYDNIGVEFKTSGCVWLGDSIAVMAGTYSDDDGTDCVFNIKGNATVKSNFRSAIGVYCVDIKEAQNVKINVANKDNVTTTDADFEAITIYDHDYIAEQATAAGKTYTPVAESVVIVK